MTHVSIPSSISTPVSTAPINSDGLGYVELFDFSKANTSLDSRIAAITTIASVCYQSPKSLGSISLYNRLAAEAAGLPSSSYEFVPILLDMRDSKYRPWADKLHLASDVFKYGEIVHGGYLLTNLRALISCVGTDADNPVFFNTPTECGIIHQYFKVFKTHIDLATARQFMRHRASWQELSRRYVSGKRLPFEFYNSPKLSTLTTPVTVTTPDNHHISFTLTTDQLQALCEAHYASALDSSIKPEEARRVLQQSMYTQVWSAWQPSQLSNLFSLRCDSHAQSEINHLCTTMKGLIDAA